MVINSKTQADELHPLILSKIIFFFFEVITLIMTELTYLLASKLEYPLQGNVTLF